MTEFPRTRTFPLEVVVAAALLCWSVALGNPFVDTFGSSPSQRYYAPMSNVAPEWAWAAVALALGIVMMGGIWMYPRRIHTRARLAALVLAAGFLGFTSAMQYQGNPATPGWMLSLVYVAAAIWSAGGGQWRQR